MSSPRPRAFSRERLGARQGSRRGGPAGRTQAGKQARTRPGTRPGTRLGLGCRRFHRIGWWGGISVISEPSAPTDPGRAYAESYLPEDEILQAARQRGLEVGAGPIGPGSGAALRFLAATIGARHVVEVGTGCGVSGLWLLRGMAADGVLTSVDVEPEHQRLAKIAFAEAGIPTARARLIAGRALDVLPRLTDGAYDLVFCDGEKSEYADYLAEALRLLRPGGVVAFDNALARNRVGEAGARDEYTVAVRELGRTIREDERLVPALLPVGDGLLVAVLR